MPDNPYNRHSPGARSSVGERSLHTREVAGSKPAAPMREGPAKAGFPFSSGHAGLGTRVSRRPLVHDGAQSLRQRCPRDERQSESKAIALRQCFPAEEAIARTRSHDDSALSDRTQERRTVEQRRVKGRQHLPSAALMRRAVEGSSQDKAEKSTCRR